MQEKTEDIWSFDTVAVYNTYMTAILIVLQGINKCAAGPCLNGATCHSGFNSFTCTCKPGYAGKVCANSTFSFMSCHFYKRLLLNVINFLLALYTLRNINLNCILKDSLIILRNKMSIPRRNPYSPNFLWHWKFTLMQILYVVK